VRLRFTSRAIGEIARIADFVRANNPAAASHIRASLYDSLQNLLLFPNLGRRQSTEGVRKIVTRRFAYLIYYTVDRANDEIVILNVKHLAQEREHQDK
jgi:plasmid stabilization system protein ParE